MTPGYQIMLTSDDNDTFLATCPVFPEVTTFGKTDDEIERAATGAIKEAIAARISCGEKRPALVKAAGELGCPSGFVSIQEMADYGLA
jgi:predicted RNase H-like HicB family nuclease